MQAADHRAPWRRIALCVVTALWLAGHWVFPEGYSHIKAFWFLIAPLALLNADAVPRLRSQPWLVALLALLLWQVLVSSRHPDSLVRPGGLCDALAVLVLVLAVRAMAVTRGAWTGLRWVLFLTAAVTMAWSLARFYEWGAVPLGARRLRNVLVYERGLNAVLTGLLAGFAMLAGMSLDGAGRPRWQRAILLGGTSLLAFATMAAQSRGTFLAAAAGIAVLAWRHGRRTLPPITAAAAGVAAYLAAFAAGGESESVPDLVSRGSSGRLDIWSVYLDRLAGAEWWIGEGRVVPLDESVLGWHVHHPHSSFLTQLVHSGLPGLLLLGAVLGGCLFAALRRRPPERAALAMLAFGLTGLLIDGAHIASLFSVPRIESLLILVPAVFAVTEPPEGPP
jgi:hypothetical protein